MLWLKSSLSVHVRSAVLAPLIILPEADPGFPVGAGGRQYTNLPDFSKNWTELRKFWSVGGGRPLRSATDCIGALVKT